MQFRAASKGAGLLLLLGLFAAPLVSSTPVPEPSIEGSDSDFDSGTVDGTTGANNTGISSSESNTAVITSVSSTSAAATTFTVKSASASGTTVETIPTQSSVVAELLGFTNSSSQRGLDYLTYAFEEDGFNSTFALAFAEMIQFQSNVWKDLNSRFQSFQSKQIVTIALLIGAIAGFLVCGVIYSLYLCISCCRRRRRLHHQRRMEERNSFTMVSPSSSTLKRGESRRTENLEKRPSMGPSRWPIDSTPQNKSHAPTIGLGIITPSPSDRQKSPAESHELSDRSGGFSSPTPSSSRAGDPYSRHAAPRSFSTNFRNPSGRRSPHPSNRPFPTSSTLPAGQLSAPPVLPSTITTSPSFSSTFSNSTIGGGPALISSSGPPASKLTIKHLGTSSPSVPNFPMPNSYSYTNGNHHHHHHHNNTSSSYSYNTTNPHARSRRPSISRPLTATTLASIGEGAPNSHPNPNNSSHTKPPGSSSGTNPAAITTTTNGRISDILAEFDFDVDEDGKEKDNSNKGSMERDDRGDEEEEEEEEEEEDDHDESFGPGSVLGDGESQVAILGKKEGRGPGR